MRTYELTPGGTELLTGAIEGYLQHDLGYSIEEAERDVAAGRGQWSKEDLDQMRGTRQQLEELGIVLRRAGVQLRGDGLYLSGELARSYAPERPPEPQTQDLEFYDAQQHGFHTPNYASGDPLERVEDIVEQADRSHFAVSVLGNDHKLNPTQVQRLPLVVATVEERLERDALADGVLGYHEFGSGVDPEVWEQYLAYRGYPAVLKDAALQCDRMPDQQWTAGGNWELAEIVLQHHDQRNRETEQTGTTERAPSGLSTEETVAIVSANDLVNPNAGTVGGPS